MLASRTQKRFVRFHRRALSKEVSLLVLRGRHPFSSIWPVRSIRVALEDRPPKSCIVSPVSKIQTNAQLHLCRSEPHATPANAAAQSNSGRYWMRWQRRRVIPNPWPSRSSTDVYAPPSLKAHRPRAASKRGTDTLPTMKLQRDHSDANGPDGLAGRRRIAETGSFRAKLRVDPEWTHSGPTVDPMWAQHIGGPTLDPDWVHSGSRVGPEWVQSGSRVGPRRHRPLTPR